MLSKLILILILLLILIIYTLYYTWTNDYSMFLFIVIFFLFVLFIYQSAQDKIAYYENSANNMLSNIKDNIKNKFIT